MAEIDDDEWDAAQAAAAFLASLKRTGDRMSYYIGDGFQMAQQGWQCPTCHRVYSPVMPMCTQCPVRTVMTTTSGTHELPDNPAEAIKRAPMISDREAETE